MDEQSELSCPTIYIPKKPWILDFAQRIPDSFSYVPDSKTQDSWYTSENSSIVDSRSKNFTVSEIRIPLHGAKKLFKRDSLKPVDCVSGRKINFL